MNKHLLPITKQDGFTLIEIAIVLVILGILAGGGISLLSVLTERKARNETIAYLKSTKEALISFANISGRLPWADTDNDGNENTGSARGRLPYLTLNLTPTDFYKRVLIYETNSSLSVDRPTGCRTLKNGLSGSPEIVDADGSGTAFPAAAVIVSAGPMDADNNGNVFDDITGSTHNGDNTDGVPNYIRHPPVTGFDDLVAYISGNELFGMICGDPVLSVNNNSTATVYVRDQTGGTDLCSLNSGNIFTQHILSGTTITIETAQNGTGAIVPTTPPNPVTLAGNGMSIDIP
ncbi:hypothetical protein BuS5_03554 [Desulfosarcina sp. BuS5]|uniref:type II secretion system protein n=1 Tax=Desulfosarcina sp. BuS5 TaxID=933262 RepID=UPI000481EE07|nr:type II secretion system protein [Desulfosarcina sp. BuS5]WDN90583.1 hypothetical protein BuS5_03554 [Desulfosarcina sp. BuS5]